MSHALMQMTDEGERFEFEQWLDETDRALQAWYEDREATYRAAREYDAEREAEERFYERQGRLELVRSRGDDTVVVADAA